MSNADEFEGYRPEPPLRKVLARVLHRRLMVLGLVILVLVGAAAAVAPLVTPADPIQQNIRLRLKDVMSQNPDGSSNLLGTDHLGRDVFSRVVHGARYSLFIAFTSAALASILGVVLGLLAGYYGGWFGAVVGRIADLQLALPLVLLAVVVVALIGPSLANIILVFVITSWPPYTRVIRGTVMQIKEMPYVEAARAAGFGTPRILFRHIAPNVLSSLIVLTSFDVARMIQFEAALGFLGLGVQPPTPTWGNMLADGRDYIRDAWWISAFPGIAIMLTAAAVNFIGDGLRDILDPRLID